MTYMTLICHHLPWKTTSSQQSVLESISKKAPHVLFLTAPQITFPNCNITTLASLCKTKLVCQILLQTADNISSFTCFNDALQSFLKSINCQTALSDIEINELKKLLLTAGPQQMIVSKSQRLISQFLAPKLTCTRHCKLIDNG